MIAVLRPEDLRRVGFPGSVDLTLIMLSGSYFLKVVILKQGILNVGVQEVTGLHRMHTVH